MPDACDNGCGNSARDARGCHPGSGKIMPLFQTYHCHGLRADQSKRRQCERAPRGGCHTGRQLLGPGGQCPVRQVALRHRLSAVMPLSI